MKTPDLRKLHHAVVLADARSYVQASERLHLTQSALSRSIQSLEAEVGITLFDRSRKGVRPTRDGESVLAQARVLLLHARTLERELELLRQAESGEVAFGVGPAMTSLFLSDLLVDLLKTPPALSVEVAVEPAMRLLGMLKDEEIEFFVADLHQLKGEDSSLFHIAPFVTMPWGFFVRSDHPLVAAGGGTPESVAQYPLVLPQTRRQEELRPLPGVGRLREVLCKDIPTLRHVVMTTDAVLVGIGSMIAEDLEGGRLVPLNVTGLTGALVSQIGLVSLAGRTPSKASELVTSRIRHLLADGQVAIS